MNFFYDSFYIKAGKETFFIKSLTTGKWIHCKSEFELDKQYRVKKISGISSNLKSINKSWNQNGDLKINPFGHSRVIIHQFEALDIFTRTLVKELIPSFWRSSRTFIFHLDYEPLDGLTDIELRVIRDYLEHCGAKEVYIINPKYSLSESKLDSLYHQISKTKFLQKDKLDSELASMIL